MAKIILMIGDTVLRKMTLSKKRITIGRRPHNDIVIDDVAISAVHAAIVTVQTDVILEDLNSTNGTQINGQPVKKHFLQDNDVIELAQYKIRYLATDRADHDDFPAPDAVSEPAGLVADDQKTGDQTSSLPNEIATIKVLSGANSGKEIVLNKALTTVGRPGEQVAVITRQAENFFITHVEGKNYPFVNGESIGAGARKLAFGDVIDLAGTLLAFSPAEAVTL